MTRELAVVEAGDGQKIALAVAFPSITPEFEPFGGRVLVQIRRSSNKAGRFILPGEAQDANKWNEAVARVVKVGPLAFRQRESMKPWPEGVWAQPGDYVRCPRYGGDRWEMPTPDEKDNGKVMFAVFNDHELIGKIAGDPLAFRAYV